MKRALWLCQQWLLWAQKPFSVNKLALSQIMACLPLSTWAHGDPLTFYQKDTPLSFHSSPHPSFFMAIPLSLFLFPLAFLFAFFFPVLPLNTLKQLKLCYGGIMVTPPSGPSTWLIYLNLVVQTVSVKGLHGCMSGCMSHGSIVINGHHRSLFTAFKVDPQNPKPLGCVCSTLRNNLQTHTSSPGGRISWGSWIFYFICGRKWQNLKGFTKRASEM